MGCRQTRNGKLSHQKHAHMGRNLFPDSEVEYKRIKEACQIELVRLIKTPDPGRTRLRHICPLYKLYQGIANKGIRRQNCCNQGYFICATSNIAIHQPEISTS